MNRKFNRTAFIWIFCNIINVFTDTFGQYNASLMNILENIHKNINHQKPFSTFRNVDRKNDGENSALITEINNI